MTRQFSIADARNSFPALVRSVEAGNPVEITRRGKRVAVLLSVQAYDRLSKDKPDLWAMIKGFREQADLERLGAEEAFSNVRDRSPGREPNI